MGSTFLFVSVKSFIDVYTLYCFCFLTTLVFFQNPGSQASSIGRLPMMHPSSVGPPMQSPITPGYAVPPVSWETDFDRYSSFSFDREIFLCNKRFYGVIPVDVDSF